MKPPKAKKIPKTTQAHGIEWIDEYAWLKDREDKDVDQYLKDENAYLEEQLAPQKELREELFQEIKARIKPNDISVPDPYQGYFYYWRTEKGKQYRVYCRKKGTVEAPEEILLDVNVLAEGKDYCALGVFEVSPDQNLLAYSIDLDGSEQFTVFVKDLQTGEIIKDQISNTHYSVEWAADNRTLFYTVLDENLRPYRMMRHELGHSVDEDVVLYEEPNSEYVVGAAKSKDEKFLFIEVMGAITTEYYMLEADNPKGDFRLIEKRLRGLEYSVESHEDRIFVLANDTGKNFRIAQAALSEPGKKNWEDFIPTSDDRLLDDFEVFKNFMVVYERYKGLLQIRIVDFRSGKHHYIEFDEPTYDVDGEENADYDSQIFRFSYESLVTPNSIFDYDMETRSRVLKKQDEIPGGYDASAYESKRIFATSHDGMDVPISLVYKRSLNKPEAQPLFLTGYGSYGLCCDPTFSVSRISLLDRGFVYAIAHIRGGSELGRTWYEDGKFLKKKNTFLDFISTAEHLIEEGYTSSKKLVISGGSAGGMLVGAVVNMRPELFFGAIAKVPFVDVINTMMDESLPLTAGEYDEWGNPAQKEFFDYMKSYSPYDNVEAKDHPHMLITAGLNDPRVMYWEPAKWIAKIRDRKTDSNLQLLYTNMGAGHGGASGRYDAIQEVALSFAFIFKLLD